MDERILIITLIVGILMFLIDYCTMDERATRFEERVKRLDSEMIELQKKIASYENEKGDNE